jgi:hypothetical protein
VSTSSFADSEEPNGKITLIPPGRASAFWVSHERPNGWANLKKRTRFRALFPGFWRDEQEEQANYMPRAITPPEEDLALALRKAKNAKPSRPVPRNKRLPGSGVATGTRALPLAVALSIKLMSPVP